MVKLKIKVTREHINKGMCRNVQKCAVAEAIIEVFPYCQVGGHSIYIYTQPHAALSWNTEFLVAKIALPLEAAAFIKRFDDTSVPYHTRLQQELRNELKEFEFEIELPEDVINMVNIEEIKLLLQNHPTLSLINA